MMSPTCSSGTVMSTSMYGSRSTGPAFSTAASQRERDPASLNAISLESTEWYFPSTHCTLTSTTGIARQGAAATQASMHALLDGGDQVPSGNGAADDLVLELEALGAAPGLDVDVTDTKHAGAAGLLLELALDVLDALRGDGLAVGHLGRLEVHLDTLNIRFSLLPPWCGCAARPCRSAGTRRCSARDRCWRVGSSSASRPSELKTLSSSALFGGLDRIREHALGLVWSTRRRCGRP